MSTIRFVTQMQTFTQTIVETVVDALGNVSTDTFIQTEERPVEVPVVVPDEADVEGTDDPPELDDERREEIEQEVAALDRVQDGVEYLFDPELTPDEAAYATSLMLDRWPPGESSGTYLTLQLGDLAATWPEGGEAVLGMLAERALDPEETLHTGELAAAALNLASTDPTLAAALIEDVGNAWLAFVATIGMDVPANAGFDDPRMRNVGSRIMDVTAFLETVQGLPPSEGQALAVFSIFQGAGPLAWGSSDFRTQMGHALAGVMALGDADLAAQEGERMAALLSQSDIAEALEVATPAEREQLVVTLLSRPGLTAELLDEHHGNLATAIAYVDLGQLNDQLTGPFIAGETLGLPDETALATPEDLDDHPAIAALGDPATVADIEAAVLAGDLDAADAAAYIRSLAAESTRIGDPDLTNYGASAFTAAAIEFFNGGNPIEKSNVDDLANRDAEQLLALADAIEASDDPRFIAEALVAGSIQHASFEGALEPYVGVINGMAQTTQRNRVLAMMAVGVAASLVLPAAAAAGLPAFGATGTIFGVGVTGSPFLSGLVVGGTSGVLSTTMNAAFQYEGTGEISWGHAIAGGTIDGLTGFFGATVAARAMSQGYGFVRAVGPAVGIDAAGGFGSYVLGTPGALEGILALDEEHVLGALAQTGISAFVSLGFNGVTYRVQLGDPPAVGVPRDYDTNASTITNLLDPASSDGVFDGTVPILGMDGNPIDVATLATREYESFFTVYQNDAGDLLVQEVARARPGTPLALEPFDAIHGVMRNAPGDGWTPIGSFHNHPSGTGLASNGDLAVDPIFRGEIGDGFASFVLTGDGATPIVSEAPPTTLLEAYQAGTLQPFTDVEPSEADLAELATLFERLDDGSFYMASIPTAPNTWMTVGPPLDSRITGVLPRDVNYLSLDFMPGGRTSAPTTEAEAIAAGNEFAWIVRTVLGAAPDDIDPNTVIVSNSTNATMADYASRVLGMNVIDLGEGRFAVWTTLGELRDHIAQPPISRILDRQAGRFIPE